MLPSTPQVQAGPRLGLRSWKEGPGAGGTGGKDRCPPTHSGPLCWAVHARGSCGHSQPASPGTEPPVGSRHPLTPGAPLTPPSVMGLHWAPRGGLVRDVQESWTRCSPLTSHLDPQPVSSPGVSPPLSTEDMAGGGQPRMDTVAAGSGGGEGPGSAGRAPIAHLAMPLGWEAAARTSAVCASVAEGACERVGVNVCECVCASECASVCANVSVCVCVHASDCE